MLARPSLYSAALADIMCVGIKVMCPIVNAKSAPQYLREFREWRIREWGLENELRNDDGIRSLVPPCLFYVERGELVGGLAFTRFKKPGGDGLALWINAVIVAAEHRGKGIGGELVREAQREAKRCNESELFVYTDVPLLYSKNGWVVVAEQDGHVVLKAG